MAIGYTQIGSGQEKVLILHGWFGDYSVWEPTFNSLDQDAFTYVFIDYRGYGKSKDLEGNYTMNEIAKDAISLINNLGWDVFHLIGHSMGGMAMQRVTLNINDRGRIKSMIGIDPVPAVRIGIILKIQMIIYGVWPIILSFGLGRKIEVTNKI